MTRPAAATFLALLCLLTETPRAQPQAQEIKPVEARTPHGSRVWMYLPSPPPKDQRLACVLVPPAGSRLFHGMALGDEDRAEQIPYVKAGFAVVSFDISGPSAASKDTKELRAAIRAFRDAEWGIRDAFEALAVAQARYPQIDRNRVYVAGHSSAGTLALQIASSTNRVSACIAFAPICDIGKRLGPDFLATLEQWVPGVALGLRKASPTNRAANLNCPVFLFHSSDDDNVSPDDVISFKNTLLRRRAPVEYVQVNSGGHYHSMLEQGIPRAIKWLTRIDQESKK